MKELYELKDKLCDELKEYGKKDMSAGSLDVVDKLTHAIKNLDKVIEGYEGYSGAMYPYAYDDGMSMARGRGTNARRDSMGRYSRERSMPRYSRGYSMDNKETVQELKELMEDMPELRQDFQRLITKVESM